ncbi:MAG: MoxR family ATPase [Candidatus Marinimicrobia bacterium]|nr:MoxR family ATPase [Candidatus Neomarinimicrobiota bacterium]MCF7829210.1 MoxR family ATPase [Candidatus Neomarinimicrobiota bacterium]MCF7881137.1 MoxR family ATPase [Candidatus Neomarinimicrobiota bacterium]
MIKTKGRSELNTPNDELLVQELNETYQRITDEVGKVIIGQRKIMEQLLIALFSRGHCVLVGVPGLAKTLLIQTLSEVLDLKFSRIQFTPDLMPSDITGTEIIEEDQTTGKRVFKFVRGPVFANIVLADEINRTPPKTQAALLEAMQEHKVTAAGTTYTLDEPFFVLATQNPIEQEGTYPLPEAQLDRFMFNLLVDYPTTEEENEIVKSTTSAYEAELDKVASFEDISDYQALVRRVPVADPVVRFAVKLVSATRPNTADAPEFINDWLEWGAGPRASQYLILGAKTRSVLEGRPTPSVEDVKALAKPVLRHRIITTFTAEADGIKPDDIIEKLVETIPD